MEIRALTYGGIIQSIRAPDRRGRADDIVLGFDTLDGYLTDSPYFGAIIGRYANRIAGGCFELDGTEYRLATNNGPNHLHGGWRGFDKMLWSAREFSAAGACGVVLEYVSPDGEEGYPGTVEVSVTYRLEGRRLTVEYSARTTRATPINLTQHSYFNLAGAAAGDVLGHMLMIHADRITPADAGLIPTGELRPVEGTVFDFRRPVPIGARIEAPDPQLDHAGGYDHNFVLNGGPGLRPAARAADPAGGRSLEVHTTEPGLQFYSGNFLDGSVTGKGGHAYRRHAGFCLETQHFP
ncbi:MAG: aldose epimerase family protein, partial [Gemmatimonadales bacterium]